MGVVIQSNACSFSEFPLKIKLTKMLKNCYIHIIGSDAHSVNRNSPDCFNSLNEHIDKKIVTDIKSVINEASAEILK